MEQEKKWTDLSLAVALKWCSKRWKYPSIMALVSHSRSRRQVKSLARSEWTTLVSSGAKLFLYLSANWRAGVSRGCVMSKGKYGNGAKVPGSGDCTCILVRVVKGVAWGRLVRWWPVWKGWRALDLV